MVQVRKLPESAIENSIAMGQWLDLVADHLDPEKRQRVVGVGDLVRQHRKASPVSTSDWVGEVAPLRGGLEILHILS